MAEFTTSINIEAPPHVVYQLLTTNAGMVAWLGQYADLDPSINGQFAVDIAGYPVRGRFLQLEPDSLVVVSWGFAGSEELPTGASTVEFRLTPIEGGTRVDLRHADLPDAEVPGHEAGWSHFLPRLFAAANGEPLGADTWHPNKAGKSHSNEGEGL